jgi:glycosyltransferase involved in cell wall biosynthesis
MRVLYSFPHKLGANRICYTAWQQVRGLASAGAGVLAMPGALYRPVPDDVKVQPTLARGKFRIPYKLLGRMNSCRLHDWIVARRLEKIADQIDIVHCWPLGSLETLKTAHRLGIPAVLERPNAHTRFCYETVAAECKRIGMSLPHHEYQRNDAVLSREEAEFEAAFGLLCPGAYPEKSFKDRGFAGSKLLRHSYGFDEGRYFSSGITQDNQKRFVALFVGVDAVRKGLHLALEAWLASPASQNGAFLIAGELSPEFKNKFARDLSHPGIVPLGHRNDVPQLMRDADVLLLPSLEEGSALVCMDAIGSGCVPIVSDACSDACQHMHNALVHPIRDTQTLTRHITMLYEDRSLLRKLRETCILERINYTWTAAGQKLLSTYLLAIERYSAMRNRPVLGEVASITVQSGISAAN